MKLFLFLISLNTILLVLGKDHSDLFEEFLDNNLKEHLGLFPFNIDKYHQNSNQIDISQADIVRLMIEVTSKIVENHVFYILDKTSNTNYIEQMASLIEKIKLLLIKMKTIQDVLSNTFNPNNTREKVPLIFLFLSSLVPKQTNLLRKILEGKYNQILAKSHEDTDPALLHFELMQLFFPELQKTEKDPPNEKSSEFENLDKSSQEQQQHEKFEESNPHSLNEVDKLDRNDKKAESSLVIKDETKKPNLIQKNSKYFYESEKPSNFLTDSDEDFLNQPSEKHQIPPSKHHEAFIKHETPIYDDNLKLLQFESQSFPNQKRSLLKKNDMALKNLFRKFDVIKSGDSLSDLLNSTSN